MNFKLTRFFYSSAHFITGTFFFLFGVYGIIWPWSTFLIDATVNFITTHALIFSLFSLSMSLIGLSIIINAYLSSKRSQAHIRVGNRPISIDENLIEQHLERYWNEQFPTKQTPFFLTIKKNSLLIEVDLPSMSQGEKEYFLAKVDKDLSEVFEKLGYDKEINLIARMV